MNTINLTPAQQFLLTQAADHHAGRVCEFPAGVHGGARIQMLQALAAREWVRANGEDWLMTAAGYAAIGRTVPADESEVQTAVRRTRANSKQATVVEMLKRPEGTTIAQIAETTGWQAHTVRGALSGTIKKKLGLFITSKKRADGARAYRIE